MAKHRFTLILSGISEIVPETADALYEATGGDIEFCVRDGVASLEFTRSTRDLRAAIERAIADVEGAALAIRVIRVESESANVIAKINADLLGVTGTP